MKLEIYTDGGSRGNPGTAGIGVHICKDGVSVEKRYKYLGVKTNNEAEYLGAYYGIKRALELGATELVLYMDSSLVINQLSKKWKIKKEELKNIAEDIEKLLQGAGTQCRFEWIPREQNKEADRLSNVAMDKS